LDGKKEGKRRPSPGSKKKERKGVVPKLSLRINESPTAKHVGKEGEKNSSWRVCKKSKVVQAGEGEWRNTTRKFTKRCERREEMSKSKRLLRKTTARRAK